MKYFHTNLPEHSEAKLLLFQKYLERYLPILSNTPYCKNISIYDLFCGTGIYDDGKYGSPILAFDTIERNQIKFKDNAKELKNIQLTINDFDENKINKVKDYLTERNRNDLKIKLAFLIEDFEMLVNRLIFEIDNQVNKTKNFIFLDPYGYKSIKKAHIESLLNNKRTEILIFLPISHMYRFVDISQIEKERNCYQPLRDFIAEFSIDISQLANNDMLSFIDMVKKGFSFNNNYYSLSYFIERSTNNYFAIFFITSHPVGCERMIEVKRGLDVEHGQGYRKKRSKDPDLFEKYFREQSDQERYANAEILLNKIFNNNQVVDNLSIYKIMLLNEFLPKDYANILKKWYKENKLSVFKNDTREKDKFLNKYISWDSPLYLFNKVDNGKL